MKVLIIGTPGVQRKLALKAIHDSAKQIFPHERIFTTSSGAIPTLEEKLYTSPEVFLEKPLHAQRTEWRAAFTSITAEFKKSKCDHCFIGMHLAYRYNQIPIVAADFRDLAAWRPDCIITLIDDAYCVRERIHSGGYSSFTLVELLLWRSEEILLGDLLARIVYPKAPPPNYVVSVRHPATQVTRLIFSHNKSASSNSMARAYLSYNISDTRQKEETRKKINHFRQKFYEQEHCFAFDPLTIDELPPIIEAEKGSNGHEGPQEFFLYNPTNPEHRWPAMELPSTLAPLADDSDLHLKLPIKIPLQELLAAGGALRAQINNRDLRLLDQSHFLAVWRPTITRGKISSGVQTEINYAKNTGCPIIFYYKKGVDQLPTSPLVPSDPNASPNFFYDEEEDEFWVKIANLHKDGAVAANSRNFLK